VISAHYSGFPLGVKTRYKLRLVNLQKRRPGLIFTGAAF
jgi:hypothetical protein